MFGNDLRGKQESVILALALFVAVATVVAAGAFALAGSIGLIVALFVLWAAYYGLFLWLRRRGRRLTNPS